MSEPKIIVIDGRGGGIGKSLVEKLRYTMPQADIIAIGTNPVATEVMLRAGATSSYTGEASIQEYAKKADLIMGVMGILIPHGLMGELTPAMVMAITESDAMKVLVPMNRCGIKVPVEDKPLSSHIEAAIELAKTELLRLSSN
ncbi:MAG: DUF3842 family protein [Eubacteriales bacterium]